VPRTPRHLLERRIWRLSFLLTGNELAAADLVDRVQRAHDVQTLDPVHLDRLVIQQAREMLGTAMGPRRTQRRTPPQSPLAQNAAPEAMRLFAVVQSLPEQPREAWVLARIDDLELLHISRAMDCSNTATQNHLNAGDEQVRAETKDEHNAALSALRLFADHLDPGPIIADQRARRRAQRARRAGIIAVLIATVLLIAALALLKGWFA
jgi:hypothetical protein